MTKQLLIFGLLLILSTGCSKEEEPEMMDPDPLTVVRIDDLFLPEAVPSR